MSVPRGAAGVLGAEQFAFYIDYDRNSLDAARVFRVMAELIGAVEHLDRALVHAVDYDAEASTRLVGIEAKSLLVLVDGRVRRCV